MKKDIREKFVTALGLDAAEAQELVDGFIEEFRQSVSALNAQRQMLDSEMLRQETHKIIGYAGNNGAMDVYEAAKELNAAAKTLDKAAKIAGIDKLEDLLRAYEADPE